MRRVLLFDSQENGKTDIIDILKIDQIIGPLPTWQGL